VSTWQITLAAGWSTRETEDGKRQNLEVQRPFLGGWVRQPMPQGPRDHSRDDMKYWVVTMADFERLIRVGYEPAE